MLFQDIIFDIIERLKKNNLLNDEVFTELFIKDKLNLSNDGEYKIINSLKEHGISASIIDKYNYLFDKDILYKKIDKVIQKNIKTNRKHSGMVLKNKIYINFRMI